MSRPYVYGCNFLCLINKCFNFSKGLKLAQDTNKVVNERKKEGGCTGARQAHTLTYKPWGEGGRFRHGLVCNLVTRRISLVNPPMQQQQQLSIVTMKVVMWWWWWWCVNNITARYVSFQYMLA